MKYAKINSNNPNTHQIIGWYDTVFADYPNEDFSSSEFVEMTDDDWNNRFEKNHYDPSKKVFVEAPKPSKSEIKQQAGINQIIAISQAYGKDIQANISFTAANGSTKVYQADSGSLARLQNMLTTYQGKQATPSGFYWVSEDNTQVPFTYADLQNLAEAIGDRGNKAFQHLQTLKNTVRDYLDDSAKTVADIEGVTW